MNYLTADPQLSGLIKELFHKEEEEASLSVYAAVQQIRTVLEENTYYNKYLSEEDKKEKILENQKIIRTPIVRNGKQATVGYEPDVWKDWK